MGRIWRREQIPAATAFIYWPDKGKLHGCCRPYNATGTHRTPAERLLYAGKGNMRPLPEKARKRQNKQNSNGTTTGNSGSRNKTNRPPVAISKSISKSLQAADMDKLSGQQEAQKPNGNSQNIKCTRSANFH